MNVTAVEAEWLNERVVVTVTVDDAAPDGSVARFVGALTWEQANEWLCELADAVAAGDAADD